MYDVITIGSATRDVFLKMAAKWSHKHGDSGPLEESLPLGSKIEVEEIVLTTGGGGTNAAVTFARQGLQTACVGVVGDDINGREILEELQKEGVDVSLFQKHDDDPEPSSSTSYGAGLTAYSTILVDPSGERTILSYKGEGQHFAVAKMTIATLQAKWLYLNSLGGHYDLLEALVNHAVVNNIKIASNPGGKELDHGLEKLKLLLNNADIYLTNKDEGAQILGWPTENKRPEGSAVPSDSSRRVSSEEVALELKKYVKGIVSVSDGPSGVFVIDTEGNKYTASVPDSPVVERTGAGDAFGSGFVAEYLKATSDKEQATSQEEIIKKCIQFATANASSVVTQYGAKAGILKKGEWGSWPLVEVVKK